MTNGERNGHPGRDVRWTPAFVVAAVLVLVSGLLTACSSCGKAAVRQANAVVGVPAAGGIDVTPGVKRLCDVKPSGDHDLDWHDGTPIVLWSGAAPAAILQYRRSADLYGQYGPAFIEHSLAVVDGAQTRGPFPLTYRASLTPRMKDAPPALLDPGRIATADLDGDGTDELVTFRFSGEAEVHWLSGKRLHEPAGGGVPLWPHRVRLGSREVLLAPMAPSSAERRRGTRPAVLRIDGQAIRRIELQGIPDEARLLEVGSVVREGGGDIDEIVATWELGNEGQLSRHRLDGRPVDAPRKIYVEFPWQFPGAELISLPASQRNVLLDAGSRAAIFFAATKPVNWVRRVDVSALPEDAFFAVGAIDEQDGAKAIFRSGHELYAVNENSEWLTWDGARWVAHAKPVPYLQLPAPAEGERVAHVVASPARGDELLAVYTRKPRVRDLTRDEVFAAAKRFLSPLELEAYDRERLPRLDWRDSWRDGLIAAERQKRGVTQTLKTPEEWKRLLPDSYAAVAAVYERRALEGMELALSPPRDLADADAGTRAEYLAWVRTVEVPAQSRLVLARRAVVAGSWTVAGEVPRPLESDVPFERVAFRSERNGITAAITLSSTSGSASDPAAGLYLLHLAPER